MTDNEIFSAFPKVHSWRPDGGSRVAAFDDVAPLLAELLALRAEGRFLIDRLTDFEPGDWTSEEAYREFAGHVVPSMERFRAALESVTP